MSSQENAKPQEIIVSEAGTSKFAQQITAGNHQLTADEPLPVGADTGPSPYDFLLMALGTCTSMTIRMYADFKKIPLEKVIVRLTHDKIHAQDCETCDEKSKIDRLDRRIELQGNLSPEQRQKLLEIANKCPVHRTLTSKIEITTELVTPE